MPEPKVETQDLPLVLEGKLFYTTGTLLINISGTAVDIHVLVISYIIPDNIQIVVQEPIL